MKKNGQSDLQIANVERAPLKLQSHHVVFLKFNFVK
jgi:hypothetical protein